MKNLRWQFVLLVLGLSGCAGPRATDPATATQLDGGGSPINAQHGPTSGFGQLSQAFPNQGLPQSGSPFATQPASNGILDSLENATESISNHLAIQPKRLPANDPVSLASKTPPLGADLYYHAGRVYEDNQDFGRAIDHYEQALQAEPQDPRTMLALARTSDRAGDLTRAESLYLEAAQLRPQDAAILNDLGLCYAKQGKLGAAIEVIERAVALSPGSVRYRNNLATVLVNADHPDAALQQLSAVHGPAVAHYNVGFLLSQQGEPAGARRHLTLALQADPRLEPARQLLAQLPPEQPGPQFPRLPAATNPSYRAATYHPTGLPPTHQPMPPARP